MLCAKVKSVMGKTMVADTTMLAESQGQSVVAKTRVIATTVLVTATTILAEWQDSAGKDSGEC